MQSETKTGPRTGPPLILPWMLAVVGALGGAASVALHRVDVAAWVEARVAKAHGAISPATSAWLREFALAQVAAEGAPVRLTHEVPQDHPCFAGHFPGQPLMPGALLLAELQEAMRRVPALHRRLGDAPVLAAAKFLAPVRPGSTLVFDLQPEEGAGRGVRFDIRCGDTVAATGRWTPGAAAP